MREFIKKSLIACCLIGALLVTARAQNHTKENDRGYFGPVLSVRAETVSYELDSGKLRRGKRKTDSVEQFDKAGRLVEERHLDDDGSILYSEKYTYDSHSRLVESNGTHSKFLYLPDKRRYSYDDRGNLIEENGYDLNGKLVDKSEYAYDEKNRKIRWTSMSYHSEVGSRPHQWTYSYDEFGRVKEERAFSDEGSGFLPTDSLGGPHRKLFTYNSLNKPETIQFFRVDGSLAKFESTTYDDRGNELEDIEYDADRVVKSKTKYTYLFDRFGNPIQLNTYEWITEDGRPSYVLTEIQYQIIRYSN